VDLSDACQGEVRGRESAFEVRVYGGGRELRAESCGILGFCAVFAGMVDEFVDGGLGAVGVVATAFVSYYFLLEELCVWRTDSCIAPQASVRLRCSRPLWRVPGLRRVLVVLAMLAHRLA
jgi:hypothetical protein